MTDSTSNGTGDQHDCPLSDEEADEIIESRLDQSKVGIDRDAHVAETRRLIADLRSEGQRAVAPSAEMAALFADPSKVLAVGAAGADEFVQGERNEDDDRDDEGAVTVPPIAIDSWRQPDSDVSRLRTATVWLQRAAMVAALLIPLALLGNRALDSSPPEPPQPVSAPSEVPTREAELVPVPPSATAVATATVEPERSATPEPTETASSEQPPTSATDVAATTATAVPVTPTATPDPDDDSTDGPATGPTQPAGSNPDSNPGDANPGSSDPGEPDSGVPEPSRVAVPPAATAPPPPAAEAPTVPPVPTVSSPEGPFPTPPPIPTIEIPDIEIPTPPPIPTIEIPQIEIPTPPPIPTIEIPQITIPTRPPIPTGG